MKKAGRQSWIIIIILCPNINICVHKSISYVLDMEEVILINKKAKDPCWLKLGAGGWRDKL